eukprot:gene1379-12000_t
MLTLNHVIRIVQGLSFWSFILYWLYLSVYDYESLFYYSTFLLIIPLVGGLRIPTFAFYGLYKIKQEEQIDWKNKYDETTGEKLDWDSVIHYVVIPNYKETKETLSQTLGFLSETSLAKTHMRIVLAMEERDKDNYEALATELIEQFQENFVEVTFTAHPSNLPGEIAGKSSNLRWAVQNIMDRHSADSYNKILITISDSDTEFHQNYFDCLTYKFCVDENRVHKIYQSPIVSIKNFFQVPHFTHPPVVQMNTHEVCSLVDPTDTHITFSSFSLNLSLIHEVGNFDPDIIAEDWHIYLKSYFHSSTQTTIEPILLLTKNYMLEGKNALDTIIGRYYQAQRHMWSFYELAYIYENFLTKPHLWNSYTKIVKNFLMFSKVFMIHIFAQIPFPVIILSNLVYAYQLMFNEDQVYLEQITFYLRIIQAFPLLAQVLMAIAHHQILRHAFQGKK